MVKSSGNRSRVIVMGNLDGMHLGHKRLLETAAQIVSSLSHGRLLVVTFEPHPRQVLGKTGFARLLNPTIKKLFIQDVLNQLNVVWDYYEIFFSESLSQLSHEKFLEVLCLSKSDCWGLVVGYNFALGRNRSGDQVAIKKWCLEQGISLEIVSPVLDPLGRPLHTSLIKRHIIQNDLSYVSWALGRPWAFFAWKVSGLGLGSKLGFPTVNLRPEENLMLPFGVYIVRAKNEIGFGWGLMHWGPKPSVLVMDPHCECHFINFSDSSFFNASWWIVEVFSFIRQVKNFTSLDELKVQIQKDVAQAYEFLDTVTIRF